MSTELSEYTSQSIEGLFYTSSAARVKALPPSFVLLRTPVTAVVVVDRRHFTLERQL